MERLRSLDEYKSLLSSYRQAYLRGYSNNYLSTDMVIRYINLKRIYFETDGKETLFFYTDEETYYRLYIMAGQNAEIAVNRKDKPVMLRNIYREGKKSETLLRLEGGLEKQGFLLDDRTVQILAKPLEKKEDIQRKYDKASAFLDRFGIKISYAERKDIEQIMNLRKQEPLLKDYHFAYETESEILDAVEKGYYRCAYNHLGEVCAVQNYTIANGTLQGGWLAVKEEYKVRYGIGSAMAYHSFLYAIEHGISNYYGWVARDNEKSMKYHQAIGYEIGDKWADEWLLDREKGK